MSGLLDVPRRTPARSTPTRRPPTERALLVLEVLLALAASAGAVGLVGGGLSLGGATARLPFGSTVLAGIALALVNGVLPTVVVVGTLRRRAWARDAHLAVGLALIGWILVQVGYLGWPPHWLQWTYLGWGVAITVLAYRNALVRRSRWRHPDHR
ncbi:hypothetical protein [Egicoccus halophilus]|uniref:Uncharacterized protein n=1 Tax=Egicoccus halophilus TaxID=1670830 RepID=A0A8J3EU77_9ACTN|nr:hypothetical protein [Egicoccus halophilus]GGI07127.1 hypothetical protein GCM10011354_22530 [Egicoccus halophilus]